MTVYVWHHVNRLTGNFHDGGGLMIVAPSLEAAREALRESLKPMMEEYPHREGECEAFTKDPDRAIRVDPLEYAIDELKTMVTIFPDAGCC